MNVVLRAKTDLELMLQQVEWFHGNVLTKLTQKASNQSTCKLLVNSVASNTKKFLIGVRKQIKACEAMETNFKRSTKDRQNRVLAALTVVMFALLPLQIFTGWYGMNWEEMPEAEGRNSYFEGATAIILIELLFLAFGWFLYNP